MKKYGVKMKKLSKGAEKIIKLLTKAKINFTIEKTFPDLKSSKGKPLRFDFAIYNSDWSKFLLLEYDGEAHFQKINHFYKTNKKYENALGRDRKKNDYCLARGIQLYRIPYWEIDNITNVCMLFSNKFLVRSRYHNDKLIPK